MEKALVLYDGDCRFCQGSVDRLQALDWLGRLTYADARDPGVMAAHPDIDSAAALERLHLVPPGGGPVRDGFFAFRWIAGRLPLLWIVWPLLWLPGMGRLGVRAYDTVARNRFVFGTCEDGACEVPPPAEPPAPRKSPSSTG